MSSDISSSPTLLDFAAAASRSSGVRQPPRRRITYVPRCGSVAMDDSLRRWHDRSCALDECARFFAGSNQRPCRPAFEGCLTPRGETTGRRAPRRPRRRSPTRPRSLSPGDAREAGSRGERQQQRFEQRLDGQHVGGALEALGQRGALDEDARGQQQREDEHVGEGRGRVLRGDGGAHGEPEGAERARPDAQGEERARQCLTFTYGLE